MLVTTLYFQNQKIEFYNSWLGKETINVDGQAVSTKRSLLGSEHLFAINSEGTEKQCRFNSELGYGGIIYDIYINGNPILKSSKKGFIYTSMIIGIAIGMIFSISNLVG